MPQAHARPLVVRISYGVELLHVVRIEEMLRILEACKETQDVRKYTAIMAAAFEDPSLAVCVDVLAVEGRRDGQGEGRNNTTSGLANLAQRFSK